MAVSMSEDKYIDVFHPIATLFLFFIFRHFTFYIGNFSRREDILKDLYTHTLTYSTVKILYRLIRNYICINKITKKISNK